jgi:hypothetical protein
LSQANIIERAFELAPDCRSLVEVRNRLNREGYLQVDAHFSGSTIKAQIRQRLNSAASPAGVDCNGAAGPPRQGR